MSGEIPATIVFENEDILAFQDIQPTAPMHVLIVPKQHFSTINDVGEENALLLGQMIVTAKELAKAKGIDESGYRLVFNVNRGGGQAVYHIHLHLIGGRQMTWPPG